MNNSIQNKIITSTSNTLVNNLSKLKNKKDRIEQGKFIVEGYHLVEEALKTNLVECILEVEKDSFPNAKVEKYIVNEAIIKKLSGSLNPQNIIAVVKMPTPKKDFSNYSKIVLLDDVSDPGNLGTIIRTAASLGYDAVVCSENTVDIYNDKVLRATQGSVFKIDLVRTSIVPLCKELKKLNYSIYGTSLKNALDIEEVVKPNKYGLIFGNEARGVSQDVLDNTTNNIKIKMRNDVESLNVAVAAAITMWEFTR